MAKHPMPDVIVVLPGILGSVLERDGREVWAVSAGAALQALFTLGLSVRELTLHGDDPGVDDLGDGVTATRLVPDLHLVPGLWKIDGYGSITRTVQNRFDVSLGHNYFEFPYDWRRDNRAHARRLRRESFDWLSQWRKFSGNPDAQLILLAHSMGGLVSRAFLELEEGWRDTRALVTLGTPYRGSLNSLGLIANGFKKGIGPLSIDLSEMLRSFTSVYQLLPIYPCVDVGHSELKRAAEASHVPKLDQDRATAALAFHRSIEAAVADRTKTGERGYVVHPVVGIAQPTLQSAKLAESSLRMLSTIEDRDDGGDGTVPRGSATPLEDGTARLAMYSASAHSSLQNATAVLTHLEGVLTAERIDPRKYRGPTSVLSLDIEDIFATSEAVAVRAHSSSSRATITAHLAVPGRERTEAIELREKTDAGWRYGEFGVQAAGTYRVTITDDIASAPVSDLIVVA